MNSLFQQWNKPFTDDMVLDGPCDVLGAGRFALVLMVNYTMKSMKILAS